MALALGTLRFEDDVGQWESEESNRFNKKHDNFARAALQLVLVHLFAVPDGHVVKFPYTTFHGGREHMTKYFSFLNLGALLSWNKSYTKFEKT